MTKNQQRDEWLRLMIELGQLDREAYRELRSRAWARVATNHAAKSPEEIAAWNRVAS